MSGLIKALIPARRGGRVHGVLTQPAPHGGGGQGLGSRVSCVRIRTHERFPVLLNRELTKSIATL